jgi:hypothetical protein
MVASRPLPSQLQPDLKRHIELKRKAVEAAARGNELYHMGKRKEALAAWAEHDEYEDMAGLIAQKWKG